MSRETCSFVKISLQLMLSVLFPSPVTCHQQYIDQSVISFREIQSLNTLENRRARGTLSQIVILFIMTEFFMQQTTMAK